MLSFGLTRGAPQLISVRVHLWECLPRLVAHLWPRLLAALAEPEAHLALRPGTLLCEVPGGGLYPYPYPCGPDYGLLPVIN